MWMTGWGWVYHQEHLGVSLEPAMVWIVGMCAGVLASGVALLRCGTTERWGLVPRTVLAVKRDYNVYVAPLPRAPSLLLCCVVVWTTGTLREGGC